MNDNQLLGLIVSELKEITIELKEQGKTLSAQAQVLVDHTRRSESNEEAVKLLTQKMEFEAQRVSIELEPVKHHVHSVETILKACGAVAAFSGFALILIQLVSKVLKL